MSERHIKAADRPDIQLRDYLGDGVYAAFDGYGVWLTAEDGIEATDAIYLDSEVLKALISFRARCAAKETTA